MKYIFLLVSLISFNAYADQLSNCMKDAKAFGYSAEKQPGADCFKLIKNHPEKVEVISQSGRYKILALGNILYLDTLKDNKTGEIKLREVLAGQETDLKNIKDVWIHEKKKKIHILHSGNPRGLITHKLGEFSNTSPLRHFRSPILNTVNRIKLLDDREEIALISASRPSIMFINEDADNVRYKGGNFVPLLLREISGNDCELSNPLDVSISDQNKEIYVLDSGKVLVFDLFLGKEPRPKRVIQLAPALKQAVSIELGAEADSILVTPKSGQAQKVSLKP